MTKWNKTQYKSWTKKQYKTYKQLRKAFDDICNIEENLYKTCAEPRAFIQAKTLTEAGLEFKAAIQCSDFAIMFGKSPDAYSI